MTTPILTREDALKAAVLAVAAETGFDEDHPAIAAIRALAARCPPLPDYVAGLVERLRKAAGRDDSHLAGKAAAMLQAQSARIAALEARIAEADRLVSAAQAEIGARQSYEAEKASPLSAKLKRKGWQNSIARLFVAIDDYLATKEPK